MTEPLQNQVERLTKENRYLKQELADVRNILRASQAEAERLRKWQMDKIWEEFETPAKGLR